MTPISPIKVFVYGTLMRGFSNHYLISSCKYLGQATTVEKYSMHVGDFPFVNKSPPQSIILGELYEVSEDYHLEQLDELEGHPNEYIRSDCQIATNETGEIFEAQMYFNSGIDSADSVFVSSGSFRDCPESKKHLV